MKTREEIEARISELQNTNLRCELLINSIDNEETKKAMQKNIDINYFAAIYLKWVIE